MTRTNPALHIAAPHGGMGEELRWMPEYTQFSTLDTRWDDED